MISNNRGRIVAITVIAAVLMFSTSAAAVASLEASTSDVTVDQGTETASVTIDVTNTGNETGGAVVDISNPSDTSNITIDGITADDPTNNGLQAPIVRNDSTDVTFPAVDAEETVSATVNIRVESNTVNTSIQASIDDADGNNVGSVTANVTTGTEQGIVSEYAGSDGVLEPTELLEAINDFRNEEIEDPTKILTLIGEFREAGQSESAN